MNPETIEIYQDIIEYKITHHGTSPTIGELLELSEYKSAQTIHAHVSELIELGLISKDFRRPRSLRVAGERYSFVYPESAQLSAKDITGTMLKVYSHIIGCIIDEHRHPSYDEVADAVGLASKNTVGFHIAKLIEGGLITTGDGHRSLIVNGTEYTIEIDEVPGIGKPYAAQALEQARSISRLS